jgi:hypothetical protein
MTQNGFYCFSLEIKAIVAGTGISGRDGHIPAERNMMVPSRYFSTQYLFDLENVF